MNTLCPRVLARLSPAPPPPPPAPAPLQLVRREEDRGRVWDTMLVRGGSHAQQEPPRPPPLFAPAAAVCSRRRCLLPPPLFAPAAAACAWPARPSLPPTHTLCGAQFEFRTEVVYACKSRPAVRRVLVTTTAEATVRTWGSSWWEVRSYKERALRAL